MDNSIQRTVGHAQLEGESSRESNVAVLRIMKNSPDQKHFFFADISPLHASLIPNQTNKERQVRGSARASIVSRFFHPKMASQLAIFIDCGVLDSALRSHGPSENASTDRFHISSRFDGGVFSQLPITDLKY